MRERYHEQLDGLAGGLADMCGEVAAALQRATHALLDCDLQIAEEVVSRDAATELRIVVSAIAVVLSRRPDTRDSPSPKQARSDAGAGGLVEA